MSTDRITAHQAFMLVLCVLVLSSLAAEAAFTLDPEAGRILLHTDTLVCVVFFGDFLLLLYRADHRSKYFVT